MANSTPIVITVWYWFLDMKTFRIISPVAVCTASLLLVGCAHLSLPAGSRYRVELTGSPGTSYIATSVKEHGNWIELNKAGWMVNGGRIQPVSGTIWLNRDAIRAISVYTGESGQGSPQP